MREHIGQFRDAMHKAGLTPPDVIEPDGKLHRFPSNGKPTDDAGWYVLHNDGIPAGAFGDWRSGASETWLADIGRKLSRDEEAQHRARLSEIRRQRMAEEAKRKASACERALAIWNASLPATDDHVYLRAKGVRAHGLRVHEGALVVPVRDGADLHSLQFIDAKEKRFLKGGRVNGCYFSLGRPDSTLCIAEGYATAASVHEATGFAAAVAFSAGNLRAVAKALRLRLPGIQILICGDHDVSGTGQTAAEDAARAVGGQVAIPAEPGDWNDVAQADGPDAVRAGIEAARRDVSLEQIRGSRTRKKNSVRIETSLSEPEPLRRPLPPAAPYPIDALGPILAPAALRIQEVIQAPDAICGQSILAAASLAVQAHADVHIDGRREPLSLYLISIAESGERKSAVDQVALDAHRAFERAAVERYTAELSIYRTESAAFEAAYKLASKGKDTAKIKDALMELGDAPESPLKPYLLVGTPTLEGLHKLCKFGQPSLGLFHDDAGEFIGGHSMSEENRAKSAAGLSRLWDCGEFDRVRASDGAEKFYGRRLAMHLMMQPVIAEKILSDDVLTGQGLLARSLLAWPGSTIGSRQYAEVDLSADRALITYRRRIAELLERPVPLRSGTRNELEPRALRLSPAAKARWIAIHDAIEADMRDGGDYASVRAWGAKAPAQILRIAGVLTLIGEPETSTIEANAIDRAAALMLYALGEAVRIVGTSSVPVEVRHAEMLLKWCQDEQISQLYSGAALRLGPGAIRSKRAFDAAVSELERAGWAIPVEGGSEVDGAHRRRVWTIWGQQ